VISERSKFITDATLGKLAKWLRLLGYNTIVYPKEAGREMLRLAQAEKRIVLTRRADMAQRQFSGSLHLLTQIDTAAQLREVIDKCSLNIVKEKMFAICLICNKTLNPVARDQARHMVPDYVAQNCQVFNQCPSCRKVYWEGTHQRNSLQFLQKHGIIEN